MKQSPFSIRKNPQALQTARISRFIDLSKELLSLSKQLREDNEAAGKKLLRIEKKLPFLEKKCGRNTPKKKLFLRFGLDDIHRVLKEGKDFEAHAKIEGYPVRGMGLNIRGVDNGFTFSIDIADNLATYGISHLSPWVRKICEKHFNVQDAMDHHGCSCYDSWYVCCRDDEQHDENDFKMEILRSNSPSIWINHYGAQNVRRMDFSDFEDFEREMALLKRLANSILYELYKKVDASYPAEGIVLEQPRIIQVGETRIDLGLSSR